MRFHAGRQHPGEKQDKISTVGRAPQRSNCGIGQSPEVCGESVFEVWSRVLCGRSVLQWLALGSCKVFVVKSRSERAFGPTLDPTDSVCVCLRTASMEWHVPGKYGPQGELFFFLIQKEPATVLGSKTLSTFFNADVRSPLFSAYVLKKCALIALHVIAGEGRDGDGCRVLVFWR